MLFFVVVVIVEISYIKYIKDNKIRLNEGNEMRIFMNINVLSSYAYMLLLYISSNLIQIACW